MLERVRRRVVVVSAGVMLMASCGSAPEKSSTKPAPASAPAPPASPIPSDPRVAARTPAQRKISEPVLYEVYRARGIAAAMAVPPGPTGVQIDPQGRALVDVRGPVTDVVRQRITALGGVVLSITPTDQSTIASMPLLAIELLAEERGVTAISAKATAAGRGR